jgi:hypothetical protein
VIIFFPLLGKVGYGIKKIIIFAAALKDKRGLASFEGQSL